jgi:LysR family transcriptional regulator, hca operon transcriptional activator
MLPKHGDSEMELRHLRYFVAVAEAGSLSEAAEKKLHTSQPSLSRQIRDMEYEVGVALFTRSATGVVMTAAGRAYLDHARIALAQVDAAREAARRAAQPAKRSFAVGFQTGVEIDWLPAVTKVLRDELRSLELNVSSDYSPDLADALMRGKIDAAFMRIEPEFPELTFVPVAQEALIVLMPSDHRLTALDEIDPQAFVGEIFISGSRKARVLRSVTETFSSAPASTSHRLTA